MLGALALAGCGEQARTETPPPTASTPAPAPSQAPAATPGDRGDEAALRGAARAYVAAVVKEDAAAATALTCGKDGTGAMYDALAGEAKPVMGDAELLSGERGFVDMTVQGASGRAIPLSFVYQDGAWCVEY